MLNIWQKYDLIYFITQIPPPLNFQITFTLHCLWRVLVMNLLLSVFTLLGALFTRRTRPVEAFPYLMVLLVFPLIFYLTLSSLRYRFPMDPIMMVLSAYGVAYPISIWNERMAKQREAVTAAPPVLTL